MTTGRINQVTILQKAVAADRPEGRPGFITKRRRGRRSAVTPEARRPPGNDSQSEPASGSPSQRPESEDYLSSRCPEPTLEGTAADGKQSLQTSFVGSQISSQISNQRPSIHQNTLKEGHLTMSLVPKLGLPAMDQKQIRSYHGRNGLRHYIVEPGLRRRADSDSNPSWDVPTPTRK